MYPDRNAVTVIAEKKKNAPKLYIVCEGQIGEHDLAGRQSIGRKSKKGMPDIDVDSLIVSRNHGTFITTDYGTFYQDAGSSNGTMFHGNILKKEDIVPLEDGDILRIHASEAKDTSMDVTMVYSTGYPADYEWKKTELHEDIAEIVIGRSEGISLFDTSVSRKHASVFHSRYGWALIDHDSLNGVFLNGKRLKQPVYLNRNDVISISGYLFFFLEDSLLYTASKTIPEEVPSSKGDDSASHENLSIWIEERNVWHRMKKKTLLKDIHMEIPSGQMVLILGGSGAGKTTFMNAVMGYEKADGSVKYNGIDIYEEYERMKYLIGYVPQQDLLRMSDSVYDTLFNSAQMRLPSDYTKEQLEKEVIRTMDLFGLKRESESLVGKLSGGQRKRLSIAVEYIGNPSLFFLDEPDSGLDGTMARSLMENLRMIADEGKIVMVISHSPDRAFELFDQVIVLAKGKDDTGHLVFYGSPEEACRFFETDQLEKIVKRINRIDEGGEGLADQYISAFERRCRNG